MFLFDPAKEVEFGNTLFLVESVAGYLLDWKLYGSRTPPRGRGNLQCALSYAIRTN